MTEHGMNRILVLGAGTMGAGIAEVAAKAGGEAVLSDVSEEQLERARATNARSLAKAVEKGKLSEDAARAAGERIVYRAAANAEGMDLVIEAVPEKMDLKKALLGKAAQEAPAAILASNTSSLSVTELAASVPRPERVVGLHFFNPPPIMPLLEIVRAEQTSQDTLQRCLAWARAARKEPIVVRDMPGFATSRLGIILGMEAIRMLETGVAGAGDIDRAMELGYRHPMGPLKLTDLVGLDVRLSIAEHLTKELGPQFAPPPLLRQLVRAGSLGKKSGEGFYRWTDTGPVPIERNS
ncbi:MAG: 3-hydroxyacyl-CoA dehydrogenase family protein [Myxococcota bacterium]